MTKDLDDLASILEILERAIAIAERRKFEILAYLLSMAVMEATEQARIAQDKRRHA